MLPPVNNHAVSHTPDGGETPRAVSIRLRRAMREYQEASPDIRQATFPEVRMNMGTLDPVLTFFVEGKQWLLPLNRAFLKKLKRDFEFLDSIRKVTFETMKRNPE
jgi:hypothetical protein